MNRHISIILQVAVWAVILLTQFSLVSHHNNTWKEFAMLSVPTLALMLVFYINYLWLAPRLVLNREKGLHLITNTVLCIGLGIAVHFWMGHVHDMFGRMSRSAPPQLHHWFFIMRDIFNLYVTAATATALQMLMRWQKTEEARLEAEMARSEAELRNLRNQISPHFLLNTLNNIYALTAFDQAKAQDAIQKLSKMLRHMLYENQEEMVKWEDEMQFLECYVSLMRIRLPQNVEVKFNTQKDATKKIEIPPLLFISLIENAFKHGISPIEKSFIHINLKASNNKIVCDIDNSNYPKNINDRSGHGIGLTQVQRRLDLSYPTHYTWKKGVCTDGKTYLSTITIET
jgi:sensor histidine kinase YesM